MKTILNRKNIDNKLQPLFLGEDLALQRYENPKYDIFLKLYRDQLTQFWTPEEINISLDASQFKLLSDNERFIFTKNLQFQTLMDSVIARGVPCINEYVSNTELEACFTAWEFFETLHSYAYSYIIKNVYSDPTAIMNEVLEDKEILARCDSVSKEYDNLRNCIGDIKQQIYLTLVNVNALEGLRFYVSFVMSFAFGHNKKMIGNADIIKAIRRDENSHLKIIQNLLMILRTEENEGFQQIIIENEESAINIFLKAANEEKLWAEYLFQNGSLLGLNYDIMSKYIEWLTDLRLEQLGLPKQFGIKKSPIGGWITPWMDSASVQEAAQEVEITRYLKNSSKSDIQTGDFSDIEL